MMEVCGCQAAIALAIGDGVKDGEQSIYAKGATQMVQKSEMVLYAWVSEEKASY